MQAINFTTARNELASVLDSVSSGEPIIITRRSAKPVVVIDAEQYEKMLKIDDLFSFKQRHHWHS